MAEVRNENKERKPNADRKPRRDRNQAPKVVDEFDSKMVNVNRISKTVKGGRKMRFNALVVVGNRKGKVGIGMGKATEVSLAIEKATVAAKRNIIEVAMKGTTIPHEITGVHGAGQVFLKPAPAGTGIIAGGPVRNVVELAGIKDIVSKSQGSNTPINIVRATFKGLEALRTVEQVAELRGKDKSEIK